MKRFICLVVMIANLQSAARGDELADKRAAYLAAGKVECDKHLAYRNAQIADDRKHLTSSRRATNSATDPVFFARRIAERTKQAKALSASNFVHPRLALNTMRVGQIGVLTLNEGDPDDSVMPWIDVVQIVDDGNMLATCAGELAWFDMNTKGAVDGRRMSIDGPFEVTGTRQYVTISGASRTVFVLAPFDPGPLPK